MKGKILSIVTAILFGATMVASPIVNAATADTSAPATEQAKPAKKKAKKKTTKAKKTSKKKGKKKAATTTEPAAQ
jgi:hypothetical protein